ncbi:MAG TPA: DUF2784 domain-containing protein, partial [Candidatus Saccharimonadales bacterium]|nr:DUF2784 domain-containing protein [Candidatus Saccharimonadales bacterium]
RRVPAGSLPGRPGGASGPEAAAGTPKGRVLVTRVLADALFLVHLAFILFVVCGGLLALRWRRVAWLHVPAVLWGAFVELTGTICPLTPWESALRRAAGGSGLSGDFIEHYLVPVVYPAGLTRGIQIALGAGVLALNFIVYAILLRRAGRSPGVGT